jgi:hypothetical protein
MVGKYAQPEFHDHLNERDEGGIDFAKYRHVDPSRIKKMIEQVESRARGRW